MRYLLVLLGLLLSGTAQALDCETPPNCADLGFSESDDPNCAKDGYLYCPFDHAYKKCVEFDCTKLGFTSSDKSSWCNKLIKCKGDTSYTLCQNLCEVGDVYYSDGTCGKVENYEASTSPKPVGVVYWLKDNGAHGKVINLHNLRRCPRGSSNNAKFTPSDPYNMDCYPSFQWGSNDTDIENLKSWDCDSFTSVAQSEDRSDEFWSGGKIYTDIIIQAVGNDLRYAAPAAKAFYPPEVNMNDPKVGAGNWYLPTIGELMDLYGYDYSNLGSVCDHTAQGGTGKTRDIVNATLIALKDKGVNAEKFDTFYRSSSEYDATRAWTLRMNSGSRYYNLKENIDYVRASLEF